MHRRIGRDRLLLEPGSLLGAHLLTGGPSVGGTRLPQGRGQWVLLRGRDTSVALAVDGWTPGAPVFGTDRLAVSGVRALLERLGHSDPAAFDLDDPDPEYLRAAPAPRLLDPRPGHLLTRASRLAEHADRPLLAVRLVGLLLLALWLLDTVAGVATGRDRTDYSSTVLALLAVLVAAPLTWVLGAYPLRRSGRNLPSRSPLTLTDGGSALLVTDLIGTHTSLPGPSLGGVTTLDLLVAEGHPPVRTVLITAAGDVLAEVPRAWWRSAAQGARVLADMERAGLQVVRHRVPGEAVGPEVRPSLSYDDASLGFLTLVLTVLLGTAAVLSRAVLAGIVVALTAVGAALLLVRDRRIGRPS